jgi:hypothetical protein
VRGTIGHVKHHLKFVGARSRPSDGAPTVKKSASVRTITRQLTRHESGPIG